MIQKTLRKQWLKKMQHFKLCQRLKLNSKLCVIVLSLNLMYKNIATLFSPFILD
jgi:hypothetical protein